MEHPSLYIYLSMTTHKRRPFCPKWAALSDCNSVVICNIRLPDAKNLYSMRVSEFVVMDTRTREANKKDVSLFICFFADIKYKSIYINPE